MLGDYELCTSLVCYKVHRGEHVLLGLSLQVTLNIALHTDKHALHFQSNFDMYSIKADIWNIE